LERVTFAAARDDSRPTLAGVRLIVSARGVNVAAADGFRLAVDFVPFGETTEGQTLEYIIPARAMTEAAALCAAADAVTFASNGQQALFVTDSTTLTTRLIEGRFPDVDRIIPEQSPTLVTFDVADLTRAVKLAAPFAAASQNVIKLAANADGLTVASTAAEIGSGTGTIDATVSGPDAVISLNVAYLAELLDAVKGQKVTLGLATPQSPAVLRIVDTPYVHVVMPMSPR
jgi:DNA polymerase-3 subunit beta